MTELKPIYNTAKSFYGKAMTKATATGVDLYSYGTKVASVTGGELVIYNLQSATTLKHIREFMKQQGFTPLSKAELIKAYMKGDE